MSRASSARSVRKRGGHLPAHDHPAEDVQDERDVGPAGVCADVGQVRDPELVRRSRDELPLDQVLGPLGLRAVADGGLAGLLPRDPAQALRRISRSTVHLATRTPSRLSSAWIFRAP